MRSWSWRVRARRHRLHCRAGDLTKCTPPGINDSPVPPDEWQQPVINIQVDGAQPLRGQITRSSNLPLGGFCDVTKISYSLLLDQNVSLAGLPYSRSWVLYGPFGDTSLVRERLALVIGASLGLPTPLTEFVELFFREKKDECTSPFVFPSDDYRGVYLVMNAVQRGLYQVNVPIAADPSTVEQGYVLRLTTSPSSASISVPMGPSVNGSVARTLALDFIDPPAVTPAQIGAVAAVFRELNAHLFQDGQASTLRRMNACMHAAFRRSTASRCVRRSCRTLYALFTAL